MSSHLYFLKWLKKYFEKVIFPFFKKSKDKYRLTKEQMSLVTINTFKGQDNAVLKELCANIFCEAVIVRTT